jgi:hypothetical protein
MTSLGIGIACYIRRVKPVRYIDLSLFVILHPLTCFRSAVSRPVVYLLLMRAIVVDVCGPKLQLP